MTAPEDSPWDAAGTVSSFTQSPPNDVLVRFAEAERRGRTRARALDIGCGAGRNAVPLARLGWDVFGIDLSWPMLAAAAERSRVELPETPLGLVLAPMHQLPVADGTMDLVVAHGIWNLATSSSQFREAVREAARVAAPGAALFVFTFSRSTLAADVRPVPGEPFVFTEFSGRPQCFLTEDQLMSELGAGGFTPEPAVPLTEYNRPAPGRLRTAGPPVIYEAGFRYTG
jgi:SAM-dependent methyltransferase